MLTVITIQEHFKSGQYPQAAQLYTQSMVMSMNRPPWEQISFVKDEISSALLNRSVAASKMGAWWVISDFVYDHIR